MGLPYGENFNYMLSRAKNEI